MQNVFKALIRRPLNALGYDVVQLPSRRRAAGLEWLRRFDIRTVIDVGAHTGDFARTAHALFPSATVLAFEPQVAEYAQLARALSGVASFRAFNCALGASPGTFEMHRSSYSQSSSLLEMTEIHKRAFPESAHHEPLMVEVCRLDDVAHDLRLEEEICIKLDVQGFEAEVIAGGRETVSRARVLVVELSFVEVYRGQPLFDEMYMLLRSLGFRYVGSAFQLLDPADASVLQADGVFVRA